MVKFQDFLNPKSMITPGIAGMVIMGISNALWVTFSISKAGSSLFLSFLLALLVLKKITAAAFYEKAIYLIFNTLIIFSLAVNTNFAGRKLSEVSFHKATGFVEQYSSGYNMKLPSGSSYMDSHKDVVATKPPTIDGQSGVTTQPTSSSIKSERKFFDPYF